MIFRNTSFLIISDTHADSWAPPSTPVDVAIHCGDLTEESKLPEFRHAIEMLRTVNADLKLVIAGNHDWTLDTPQFKRKVAEAGENGIAEEDIWKEWGNYNEAQELLANAGNDIVFLDEGQHEFDLKNGAKLTVFASPYTPSIHAGGAFQYTPTEGHKYDVGGADVVVTHCPPRGVLDRTHDRVGAGCPNLFDAVARARPRLHCFGHIHEGWGAKLVTWRGPTTGDQPLSHMTAINGDTTKVIESLRTLHPTKFDTAESRLEKADKLLTHMRRGFCEARPRLEGGEQTLFVNAAIQGPREGEFQLPWVVDIPLPASTPRTTVDAPPVPTTCHPRESDVPGPGSVAASLQTTSRKRPLSDAEETGTSSKRPKNRLLQRCRPKPTTLLSFEPACI